MKSRTSFKYFAYLLAALTFVSLSFYRVYKGQTTLLTRVESDYANGRAINLSKETNATTIADFLANNNYIKEPAEAKFVANHILSVLRSGKDISTINALNSRRFAIKQDSVTLAMVSGYTHLTDRFESQREKLGMCSDIERAYANSTGVLPSFEGAVLKMRIKIKDSESNALVTSPVVLRITEHWNEVHSAGDGRTSCESRDSVYAYICVAGGKTTLSLPKFADDGSRRYFSILPVKDGYYYGTAKGTYKNKWNRMKFFQREASIPPFEPTLYREIKDDCTITVRTPDDYRRILSTTIMTFWAVWILLFAVLAAMDAKSQHRSNLGILAIGATLTGLGLSTLFAIPNPLSAQLLGFEQLIKGVIPGAIVLAVCAAIDWNKFFCRTRDRWLTNTSLHGIFFAIMALLLTFLTIFFGTGPEGSGAKINLNLGFISVQPAPVISILLALYFAFFLTNKESLIQGLATKSMCREDIQRRSKLVSVVFVFTLIIIGLQIFALGDMGPALCTLFVAICIYSLVRQDFTRMIVGVGSFILLSWAVKMTSINVYPLVTVAIWITMWVIYGYFVKKRLFESAILMILIIAGLMYGGEILSSFGANSAGERLAGRVEMSLEPFDNEVSGGDQVAHSAWAVSNGGVWGRTGEFNCARTIPAAHTDIILPSLAETNGLLGVAIVLILFGILVYYAIAAGLKNGRVFAYNLSVLMGLGIGVQAMVIMLGAIGIIPLTGVNLPFLSQGSSALVIQLAGLGIIISVSRQSPLTEINTRKYAAASSVLMGVFCLLSIVIFIKCANWVLNRDEYLVKPAYIRDIHGNRIVEYNPRIANIMKMMRVCSIVDRNGLVLATSDGEYISQDSILARYEKLGVDRSSILSQIKGYKRIYPLYRHMFFTIGDTNKKIMWGGAGLTPGGLLAEERWYSRVRGYNTTPDKRFIFSTRHHSDFLPDEIVYQSDKCVVYDYSALLPVMKSSNELKKWNAVQKERDIQLTIDAGLQVLMNTRAEQYVKEQRRKNNKITDRTRIGVAIVDGATGEVLCTSIYPLADPYLLAAKAKAKEYVYHDDLQSGFKAYSDRDLAATYATAPGSTAKTITSGAGLRKFGIAYAGPEYAEKVYADEIVDVSLGEPTGNVDLNAAIVGSSNVFFIKSAARYNLFGNLGSLFWLMGAHVGKLKSYYLYPDETLTFESRFKNYVDTLGYSAVSKFRDYEASGIRHRLIDAEYQETWGQGQLTCTPLALARYLGAVGNNGILMSSKYTTFEPTTVLDTLMSKDEADALFSCMKNQAAGRFAEFGVEIGGKTGTSVRVDRQSRSALCNDAWYAFVIKGRNGHPYSVVVRLERVHANSSLAMEFTKEVILPVLSECDYLQHLY